MLRVLLCTLLLLLMLLLWRSSMVLLGLNNMASKDLRIFYFNLRIIKNVVIIIYIFNNLYWLILILFLWFWWSISFLLHTIFLHIVLIVHLIRLIWIILITLMSIVTSKLLISIKALSIISTSSHLFSIVILDINIIVFLLIYDFFWIINCVIILIIIL